MSVTVAAGAAPCLSVLIPTYNQTVGVARIFASLQPLRGCDGVEILVSDDSPNDGAAEQIAATCAEFGGVRYIRNQPALGAVPNWNRLLDLAVGRYCLLLHHDEEIAASTDLARLVSALRAPGAPDAWILACHVVREPGMSPQQHFPTAWAAWFARRCPTYLLRRNLIGPPSVLVVRRERYVRFDVRLRWLVDVDAYCRTFQHARDVRAWPSGGVISHRDVSNSVTAQLAPRLAQIEAAERELLADRHAAEPGLRWLFTPTGASRALRAGEAGVWLVFRVAYRLRQRLARAAGMTQI